MNANSVLRKEYEIGKVMSASFGQGPGSSVGGMKCHECRFPEDEVASFLPAPKLAMFSGSPGILDSLSL